MVIRFSLCSKYPMYANVITVLNAYLDKFHDIISSFDEFAIKHLPREENGQANALAQQASGYDVRRGKFNIKKPMQIEAKLQVLDEPVKPVDVTGLTA